MVKNPPANAGDLRDMSLIPVFPVGKIPWRRAWQPTPVFLPGEAYGQRSLAGYRPQGCKESDMTEATAHNHTSIHARVASRQSKTGWQGADLRVERVDAASPVSLMAALLMVSQLLLKNVNECVWRIHRISWFLFDWKRFVLQRGQLKVGGMGGQGKDWEFGISRCK